MRLDLFLISLLTLFLELTCIRWFPSHVLFLTFFTNTVLLASILGIVGRLPRRQPQEQPAAVDAARPDRRARQRAPGRVAAADDSASVIDVGNQASPQMVFFGVEYQARDLSSFVIPIEAICGYFFLVIALAMMGPGQQLGRCLARIPNRLEAYTIDILGSIAGIVLFAACSFLELPPTLWFALVMAGFSWFLVAGRSAAAALALDAGAGAGVGPGGGARTARAAEGPRQMWSPYYRIDYQPRRAAHQRQPDRPSADAAARCGVSRLRAAAPAQS